MSSLQSLRGLTAAFVLLAVNPTQETISAQSACLPQAALANVAVKYVTSLVTATDTANTRVRAAHGLESALASEVYVVSDSARCRNAALALERTFGDSSGTAAPVWLLQAGPNRVVVFNSLHHDPYGTISSVVFDTLYVRKAILAGL